MSISITTLCRLFVGLLLACGCFQSVSAQPTAPGISFSPTVINFGQIPIHEQPTQLLTVTFSRPLFSPDHLPSLRLQGSNGPTPLLFSHSITPDAITLVYRVKMPNYGEDGAFQYQLILAKEGARDTVEVPAADILDAGVLVQGEEVQGLEGFPNAIDFGPVRYGKRAVKDFRIGFFHSPMIYMDDSGKPPKAAPRPSVLSREPMSVISTSPYVSAVKEREMGMDASAWVDWKIVLSPKAPQKKLEAALTFQAGDGYFFTVPVTADLSGPGYPIAPWEPSKRKKH